MSMPPALRSSCPGPWWPTSGAARAMFELTVTAHIDSWSHGNRYPVKESNRVNICFAPTEEISSSLSIFESWCLKTLARQSKELLGQEQTESQIRERFQSSLKTSEKGWTSFRAKMNITGRNAVQCWNLDKTQRSPPDCWRDCKVIPKLHFKSLYVMNKDLGLIIDVTHCMVEELDKQCPFD